MSKSNDRFVGSITRLAVYALPYRHGTRYLIIGHIGGLDCVRKATRGSQLKVGDSVRTREEIARREIGNGEVEQEVHHRERAGLKLTDDEWGGGIGV